jgi:hypothetical protein
MQIMLHNENSVIRLAEMNFVKHLLCAAGDNMVSQGSNLGELILSEGTTTGSHYRRGFDT